MIGRMRSGTSTAEDGTALSYFWRSGTGDSKPLVLVPGLGMSGQTCFGLSDKLNPDRPVAVIEPRGSGRSGAIRDSVDGAVFANDAMRVLDELQWDRVHVAGVSMGGMIAQHMAVRHRQRLLSVSLVNTYASADPWAALVWRLRETLALLEDPSTQRIAAAVFLTSPEALETNPAIVDTLFGLWEATPPDPVSYRNQMGFCAAHDLRHELRRIEIPALVISAADDLLCTPRAGEELAGAIRGHYVCLDDAAHLLTAARPGEVANLIEKHLQATEINDAS